MLYFSQAPVTLKNVDIKQYEALKKFEEDAGKRELIENYESIEKFRDKFRRHLVKTVKENPYLQSLRPQPGAPLGSRRKKVRPKSSAISEEAKSLLQTAGNGAGMIAVVDAWSSLSIKLNGQEHVSAQGATQAAKWRFVVIDELL